MLYEKFNPRDRCFLLISYLAHQNGVFKLLNFLPETFSHDAEEAWKEIIENKKKLHQKKILKELKEFSLLHSVSPLTDIHPDWMVRYLEKETPRVIATILRYLPAEKNSLILEKLSVDILEALPPLNQTFALDGHLSTLLKDIFEKELIHPFENQVLLNRVRTFDQIYLLRAQALRHLYREIGFRELSLAFTTLNERTTEIILNRLPPPDAKRLKMKINQKSKLSETRLKQAQTHVLSLDLNIRSSRNLVLEVGFFLFSKAILSEYEPFLKMIKLKFPIVEGEILMKYAKKNLPNNNPKNAKRYQKEIERMMDIMFMDI